MDVRDVQLFKLEILKDVIKVCEKHNLTYYLYGGTLLGCIRHNGFIPWDDDIDIALKWNDYKKLLKILKTECSKKYFVQNSFTDKEYPCLWTQIRVNGTTSMPVELKELNMHWGICIDIFPLISLSNDDNEFKKQRKAFAYARALLAKDFIEAKKESAVGGQKFINLIPNNIRHFIVNYIFKKYAKESKDDIYISDLYSNDLVKKYKYSDFAEVSVHSFEDSKMAIPKNYDSILKECYGDYMKLPPIEERGGHELLLGETIIDFNKDYSYYK